MAYFRSLEPPERRPDAYSASRSALESRGQSSSLPLAIVDGPVHREAKRGDQRAETGRHHFDAALCLLTAAHSAGSSSTDRATTGARASNADRKLVRVFIRMLAPAENG